MSGLEAITSYKTPLHTLFCLVAACAMLLMAAACDTPIRNATIKATEAKLSSPSLSSQEAAGIHDIHSG